MQRTILITGGTGALGRAVVQRFVQAGEKVHVPWIAPGEVRELETLLGASFGKVQLHARNVTGEKDVAELFADILARG